MAKSLAELRAEMALPDAPKARSERAATICLRPDLVAKVQSLTGELEIIENEALRDIDGDGPPRRLSQGADPRSEQIRVELSAVVDEMAEHEGELKMRANLTDGEWRRWCNEHPSRKEGDAGYERDLRVTSGFCNSDDLMDSLGQFVHTWNSEPISAADWSDLLEPVLSGGDKSDLARAVVEMYENRVDFRRWRSGLSAILQRSSDSASLASSEPLTSASTAGSH